MSYPRSFGRLGYGHSVAAPGAFLRVRHGHLVAQTYIHLYYSSGSCHPLVGDKSGPPSGCLSDGQDGLAEKNGEVQATPPAGYSEIRFRLALNAFRGDARRASAVRRVTVRNHSGRGSGGVAAYQLDGEAAFGEQPGWRRTGPASDLRGSTGRRGGSVDRDAALVFRVRFSPPASLSLLRSFDVRPHEPGLGEGDGIDAVRRRIKNCRKSRHDRT